MEKKLYSLPKLSYELNALAPVISEQQLKLHYEKHHMAYVNVANALLEKFDNARKEGKDLDLKADLKALSFNIGGHVLHSLMWENLAPQKNSGNPNGKLKELLESEFGSCERFKKEFSDTAKSVEGSGWAALSYCRKTNRPIIMQVEKHNVNIYPMFKLLLVLDVWEHAYYLDYKNDRAKFVENFWGIVNWNEVSKRLEEAMK